MSALSTGGRMGSIDLEGPRRYFDWTRSLVQL
jgi:hypothetical protein